MSWAPGTIVVCINSDGWIMPGGIDSPDNDPVSGEYCTVEGEVHDSFMECGIGLQLVGYPDSCYDKTDFRLAEGGACESERARAMNTNKATK